LQGGVMGLETDESELRKPLQRHGFLRRLERARAPSFADVLLAMPQDSGEFSRRNVRMRDLEL
jgi:hypothetical protein